MKSVSVVNQCDLMDEYIWLFQSFDISEFLIVILDSIEFVDCIPSKLIECCYNCENCTKTSFCDGS